MTKTTREPSRIEENALSLFPDVDTLHTPPVGVVHAWIQPVDSDKKMFSSHRKGCVMNNQREA